MAALPAYVTFWSPKLWSDLPDRSTPITAASLNHWDAWNATVRARVEEVAGSVSSLTSAVTAADGALDAAKVNKTTAIVAGSGLLGGGTLEGDRTLSVDWGAGHGQVRRGDESLPAPTGGAIAAGDLLVGTGPGALARLPKAPAGRVLASGASTPTWIEPVAVGFGLPTANAAGQVLIALPDGSWTTTPEASLQPGMVLVTSADAPNLVEWQHLSNLTPTPDYTSGVVLPVSYTSTQGGVTWTANVGASLNITRLRNTVRQFYFSVPVSSAYKWVPKGVAYTFTLGVALPPEFRPATAKTYVRPYSTARTTNTPATPGSPPYDGRTTVTSTVYPSGALEAVLTSQFGDGAYIEAPSIIFGLSAEYDRTT